MELLALYNRPPVRDGHVKYYTVKVPLQLQACEKGVKGVEANWLDHMTQHFNNGASLVDGYFHLGNVNGKKACFNNNQIKTFVCKRLQALHILKCTHTV